MDELTQGLRRLRLSLVPLLVSQIALSLVESSEALVGYELKLPSMLSSAALALLSYLLFLRGMVDVCNALGGTFCTLRKLAKYLLPATLLFTVIGVLYSYEDLQGFTLGVNALLERPILLLVAILFTLLLSVVAYSLSKLGSSVGFGPMRLGPVLLIPSPLIVVAGYPTYGSLVAAVGSLVSLFSLTKIIRAGVEVVEEERAGPEEYEEVEETPPEQMGVSRGEKPRPPEGRFEVERTPVIQKGRGAKLLGPNGLIIELELGMRVFGRRDFMGYVPEEELGYVSRRHFEIKGTREGFLLRDLGSLNGTWVNGIKLRKGEYVKLTNGSVIDVAEVVRLRFSMEAEDLGVPEI